MPDDDETKTHEETSARRAAELSALGEVHRGHVARAHDDHPTPSMPFSGMAEADQRRWNEKRAVIDSANTAYNRAVRAACERHREEDVALTAASPADEPDTETEDAR